MEFLIALFVFIFGLVIGSFLNVVIYRLPLGLPLTGRSNCPNCKKTLSPKELVPVFSFLLQKRKCRNCDQKISWRYMTIELITGVVFLSAWLWLKPESLVGALYLIKILFVLAVLIVIFVIDWEHFLILDKVLLPSAVVIFLFNLIQDRLSGNNVLSFHSLTVSGVVAAFLATMPFFLVWFFSKGLWMGFGDVKLTFFLGLLLSWPNIWVCLLLAVFLGGFVSVFLLISQRKTLKSRIPFGTFLSLAAVITLFFGPKILAWYLGILGF